MSNPSDAIVIGGDDDSLVRVGLVALAVFVLLYSVVVTAEILLGIVVVGSLFVVYLAWRFVRAHERLADAVEAVAAARTDGTEDGTETED